LLLTKTIALPSKYLASPCLRVDFRLLILFCKQNKNLLRETKGKKPNVVSARELFVLQSPNWDGRNLPGSDEGQECMKMVQKT